MLFVIIARYAREQENDSKTARAEKKATDEIKLREQKEKEIQELQFQARKFLAYDSSLNFGFSIWYSIVVIRRIKIYPNSNTESFLVLMKKKVEKLMRDKESMKRLLDKDMVYEKYLQSGWANLKCERSVECLQCEPAPTFGTNQQCS